MTTTKRDKLKGYFVDENHGHIFKEEELSNFKESVRFQLQYVHIEQKEYIHRLSVADKFTRMTLIKSIASKFFEKQNFVKAKKLY